MCNVCVADQALATTACGNVKCMAFAEGHAVAWTTAPTIDFKKALSSLRAPGRRRSEKNRTRRRKVPRSRASARDSALALGLQERPTVFVRARGKGAEVRGEFQVRRQGSGWPKEWQKTDDVAGAMAMYGLDIKWKYVPKLVQAWARFETSEMPTLDVLHDALDALRAKTEVSVAKARARGRRPKARARAATKNASKRV